MGIPHCEILSKDKLEYFPTAWSIGSGIPGDHDIRGNQALGRPERCLFSHSGDVGVGCPHRFPLGHSSA